MSISLMANQTHRCKNKVSCCKPIFRVFPKECYHTKGTHGFMHYACSIFVSKIGAGRTIFVQNFLNVSFSSNKSKSCLIRKKEKKKKRKVCRARQDPDPCKQNLESRIKIICIRSASAILATGTGTGKGYGLSCQYCTLGPVAVLYSCTLLAQTSPSFNPFIMLNILNISVCITSNFKIFSMNKHKKPSWRLQTKHNYQTTSVITHL